MGFAIGVGVIVTIGLWIRHGGVGAASGPGALATATGQVTALVGTYAILVQILFMSRIAWLERAVGLDHLAVWHRWLGFATVWLISAHVVFTTVGYARGDRVSLWAQTRDFVSHYPDVLMAWVGFALFLGVAVASVRAARRRLQRETWYFIHLYAYLAVALSFAHQLAVGTDLDGDRAARVWWVGLYIFVFGSILVWRVALPVRLNRAPSTARALGAATKRPALSRSISAVVTSTGSAPNRASSSCGASSPRPPGGRPIRSRFRRAAGAAADAHHGQGPR